MKKLGKKLLKYIILLAVTYVAIIIARTYISDKVFGFSQKYVADMQTFFFCFLIVGFVLVLDLMKSIDAKQKTKDKATDEVKDSKGNTTKQFFDKDFLTDKDMKDAKGYNYNTFSSIRSEKKDGILVRAQDSGHGMEINFVEPIHALCVGTTSSGKTTRFVVPSLQIMSMTASKPSFVITDPKGELYEKCCNKFEEEGYDVRVLNLRDPFASVQWNPLAYPYDMYTRSYNLAKEAKVHPQGDNPKNYNLIIQRPFDYETSQWFEFDGKAYVDQSAMENDMRVLSIDLRDKTYTALEDICATFAPVESAKDPNWEKTARRLIHAVMLAMLEDTRVPELNLTKEKFNLYNIYKICNITDSGRDTYASIRNYLFNYRDPVSSKVAPLASTALQNADNTSKNYMGFVSSMVSIFSDTGISFMTSRSEIDFVNMDEKPTAIFCIIPDEIRTRYPLAILFITQLYKRLVDKANSLGGKLKRNVYFMLDEFGNMPKFPDFGSIMTVGRSRGIFFELCVQSYSQLYQTYGQDEGKIIKDNCPIQIYIASEDMVTNKEFSELLGKKTIVLKNENVTKNPDGKETKSYSTQTQSIPIAYPEELMSFRDQGLVAIKTFTPNNALKTTITPYFKSKLYNSTPKFGSYVQRRLFDENKIYYDIKKRNSILSSQNSNDDDDDDDLF